MPPRLYVYCSSFAQNIILNIAAEPSMDEVDLTDAGKNATYDIR